MTGQGLILVIHGISYRKKETDRYAAQASGCLLGHGDIQVQ